MLARDPPRMTAVERKCKCRMVGQKKRRRRNFIGFATDKAARERSALRACQATRIPARHPVCRIFVPVTIPISLAVDNSNFPAPPPLFQRQPGPRVVTDPSVLHVRWLIKLCRQLAFVPSREAVSLKRSCHSSFTFSSSSRWCSSLRAAMGAA